MKQPRQHPCQYAKPWHMHTFPPSRPSGWYYDEVGASCLYTRNIKSCKHNRPVELETLERTSRG